MKLVLAIARPARMCMQCSELPSTTCLSFQQDSIAAVSAWP